MPPKHQDYRSVTSCLAWGVCLFGSQSALNKIGSPGLDMIGNIQDQSQLVSGFYCLPPPLLFISIIQKDAFVFNQNFWFYFVCMGVLPACIYVNHTRVGNLVPVEVRRMHWIPWNWSCIGGCEPPWWYWEPNLCLPPKAKSVLNHWTVYHSSTFWLFTTEVTEGL